MSYFGKQLRIILLSLCSGLVLCTCLGTGGVSPNSSLNQSHPEWIRSRYPQYYGDNYVTATGSGKNAEEAKKRALSNLVAFFGQTIQVDQKVFTTYSEAVKNGATANWTESTALEENISTYAANTLIGAEVPEPLYDNVNTWYALAAMDKAVTKVIYTGLINANKAMITNLVNMTQAEKNTIEGFSRYHFAAVTADVNMAFGNVLKVIGAPAPEEITRGEEYWLEAANIAKAIPVRVLVVEKRNDIDRANSISNAFSRAISEAGFRTTSENSRYTLEVSINLSEVHYPNRQSAFINNEIEAEFARYEISAGFMDREARAGILPLYSINGEAAHSTLNEAENRAIMSGERKINEQYKDWLLEQLTKRLPANRGLP